jgi:cytochrome c oxidase subunit 2
MRIITAMAAALAAGSAAGSAAAQQYEAAPGDIKGAPRPGEISLQPAATELMRDLTALDTLLNWLIAGIVIFVVGLMAYVAVRFRAGRNPEAARFTHNSTVEVIWTAVPVMILVAIAFPSLNLLYKQLEIPEAEVTLKAIGNQWYWDYEYPDYGIDQTSIMVAQNYASWDDVMASEAGREEVERYGVTRDTWRLATDAPVVLPIDTVIRVQTTANDVIHAWTVPSFGHKMDSIPGRLNEFWFRIDEPGTYFGQCSELCGSNHAYMPIEIQAVTREAFDGWVEQRRADSGLPPQETRLAAGGAGRAPVALAAAE